MQRPARDILVPGIVRRKDLERRRILSASGVLNITGRVTAGMRLLACAVASAARGLSGRPSKSAAIRPRKTNARGWYVMAWDSGKGEETLDCIIIGRVEQGRVVEWSEPPIPAIHPIRDRRTRAPDRPRPVQRVLTKPYEAMKRRPRPIADVRHMSVFLGIPMDVIDTTF